MTEKYPMKMIPAGKDYLWGGEKLYGAFHKTGTLHPLAESWELSCHRDGESTIGNGSYEGLTLREYVQSAREDILGSRAAAFDGFPILIKLIDAAKPLSVQVHPDNEYAQRVEKEYGKTEMWYVLECDPGAKLLFGLNRTISKEEFRRRIDENTLLEVANEIEVRPGDVFFVEPGTLHAIGAGIVIAEIQQNSNTTYRVYDYGRVGADGKPRALHIDQAMDVTSLQKKEYVRAAGETVRHSGCRETPLASCAYFTVSRLDVENAAEVSCGFESFVCLLCADGEGTLEQGGKTYPLRKGETWFLPAGLGTVKLDGRCAIVKTTV